MKKRAIVVGINNYSILDPSGNSNLSQCVSDARSMNHMLRSTLGFTDIWHYEDLRASRTNILRALRHVISLSEAGDTICFYFSGHGSRIRADLSQADCDMYYEALVPASGAFITDRDLMEIAEPLYPDAVNFTIITDACHSGGLHTADANLKCRTPLYATALVNTIVQFLQTLIPCGLCLQAGSNLLNGNVSNVQAAINATNGAIDLDPDPDLTLIAASKATLLSACRYDELSWESSTYHNGLFTKSLLEIINQSGLNYLDILGEVRTKVEHKIIDAIRPDFPGVRQTPQLFGQRNRMEENFLEGYTYSPAHF